MNKVVLLIATAAVSLLSSRIVHAADLPQAPHKAAPVAMPMMYNWSGFYIGANGGYGWSNQCVDVTAINGIGNLFAEGCKNGGGGVIGGQMGYRWQAGALVFGLEGQGDWANIRYSRASLNPNLAGDTWKSTINGLGLFTGQIGYAANEVLFYAKGGAAVGSQNAGLYDTFTGTGIAYASRTRWGGVVGLGIEYGFAPNWSAGVEWDYLWRVSDSTTWLTPSIPRIGSVTANTRSDLNLLTLRVNYRFGGPVVAKY